MKVDLFTFIFQIVNFIILIFLLYYFLFRRIVKVMDKREKLIQSKIDEASENKKKAEEEKNQFFQQQKELENLKNNIFEKCNKEAKEQKDVFLANTKKEIEENKKLWLEEIEKQKKIFLGELRVQISKMILEISNKVLKDLSNQSISTAVIEYFIDNLKKEELRKSYKNVTIESAFEFDDAVKQKILERLKQSFNNEICVKYEINPELVMGINFQINSKIIRWNIKNYLENFDSDLNNLFKKIEL